MTAKRNSDITDIGFAMPAIAKQFHPSGSEALFVALAVGWPVTRSAPS